MVVVLEDLGAAVARMAADPDGEAAGGIGVEAAAVAEEVPHHQVAFAVENFH